MVNLETSEVYENIKHLVIRNLSSCLSSINEETDFEEVLLYLDQRLENFEVKRVWESQTISSKKNIQMRNLRSFFYLMEDAEQDEKA